MISVFGPHGAHFVLLFFPVDCPCCGAFEVARLLIAVRQDMHNTHSDGRWTRLRVRGPAFGSSIWAGAERRRGGLTGLHTRSSGQLPTGFRPTHKQMLNAAGRSMCLSHAMLNVIRVDQSWQKSGCRFQSLMNNPETTVLRKNSLRWHEEKKHCEEPGSLGNLSYFG